jgi:hypothetical protein
MALRSGVSGDETFLTPRTGPQLFIQLRRIVGWKNTNRNFMRRGPFLAEVTQRAGVNLVAPDARAQKCPRQRAAYPARIILEVEIPEILDTDSHRMAAVPAASNDHLLVVASGQLLNPR